MVQYKLGTGNNYATLSGFTWPLGENPSVGTLTFANEQEGHQLKTQDYMLLYDRGIQRVEVVLEGELTDKNDFLDLRKQANKSSYSIQNEVIDEFFEQKLYRETGRFVFVKRGQFQEMRTGVKPLIYGYRVYLVRTDPFEYSDTENEYPIGGQSASNGVPSNISGIANSGNAYGFPSFKIARTSGTISQVQVTYGSKTVTWIGTLDATYDTLVIDQRNGHALRYSGGNLTDYLDYSGVVALDSGVSSQSMSITVYGGNATVSVLSRARFW